MKYFSLLFILFITTCSSGESDSLILISTKSSELSHFSNQLSEKHLSNISNMQNIFSNLLQLNSNQSTEKNGLNQEIAKYFSNLDSNISSLKTEFQSKYEFCSQDLDKYTENCKTSSDELNKKIEFNNKYRSELQLIKQDLGNVINRFYNSNIEYIAKNIIDITERNDVIEMYSSLSDKLNSHLEIFKKGQYDNNFLSNPSNNNNMIERNNKTQMIFDKVISYMSNSISRKTKLLINSNDFLDKMRINDLKVKQEIDEIKKKNVELDTLRDNIINENKDTYKIIKQCEIVDTLTKRCEEISHLYDSIMSAYNKQTETLQSVYSVIFPQ